MILSSSKMYRLVFAPDSGRKSSLLRWYGVQNTFAVNKLQPKENSGCLGWSSRLFQHNPLDPRARIR